MGFGMTPATNWPVPTPDDFPTFIQFQEDGVNLGGPDADTVNFTGNVSVTRGEGESANVITVDVAAASSGESPSGSTSKLYLYLDGSADETAKFNRDLFTNWVGETLVPSTQAEWNQTAKTIDILEPGYYEFRVRAKIDPDPLISGDWPTEITAYGVAILTDDWSDQTTLHTRNENGNIAGSSGNNVAQWCDAIVVPIFTAGPAQVAVFAEAYDFRRDTPAWFSCEVVVERVGDAPPTPP
jgi:hypothetical protein